MMSATRIAGTQEQVHQAHGDGVGRSSVVGGDQAQNNADAHRQDRAPNATAMLVRMP